MSVDQKRPFRGRYCIGNKKARGGYSCKLGNFINVKSHGLKKQVNLIQHNIFTAFKLNLTSVL